MDAEPYEGGNRLLDGLSRTGRLGIVSNLAVLTAEEPSHGLARGEAVASVSFPIDAVFSVLVELHDGESYEVDTVGRSSLIGGEMLLGAPIAARSVICQLGGRFARMPVAAFSDAAERSTEFRTAVLRSLHLQWFRSQQTVACNFRHDFTERCARWILMTQDEVGRDAFHLRREYLSMMLGCAPAEIELPMQALETVGAIRYADEDVAVLSSGQLHEAACECFAATARYRRTIAGPSERSGASAASNDAAVNR